MALKDALKDTKTPVRFGDEVKPCRSSKPGIESLRPERPDALNIIGTTLSVDNRDS